MSWIDDLLNFAIPPAIVIFLAWILYVPFKEPIDSLINRIKSWREDREQGEVELNINKYINYEQKNNKNRKKNRINI